MLCCRCGVSTDGVELNPGVRSPICPACAGRAYAAGKRSVKFRQPTKPGPPAIAGPPKKSRRRKKS